MSSPMDDNTSMNSQTSEESHIDVDELKREQLLKLTVTEDRNSSIRYRLKAKNESLENELKHLNMRSAKLEEHNRNKSEVLEKFHTQWKEGKNKSKEELKAQFKHKEQKLNSCNERFLTALHTYSLENLKRQLSAYKFEIRQLEQTKQQLLEKVNQKCMPTIVKIPDQTPFDDLEQGLSRADAGSKFKIKENEQNLLVLNCELENILEGLENLKKRLVQKRSGNF